MELSVYEMIYESSDTREVTVSPPKIADEDRDEEDLSVGNKQLDDDASDEEFEPQNSDKSSTSEEEPESDGLGQEHTDEEEDNVSWNSEDNLDDAQDEEQGEDVSSEEEEEDVEEKSDEGSNAAVNSIKEEEGDNHYTLEEFVGGKCNFQCNECSSFRTSNLTALWQHTSGEHDLDAVEYKEKHGSSYVQAKAKIECPACFKHILHESDVVREHCNSAHEMDAEEFHAKYYGPPKSEETAENPSYPGKNYRLWLIKNTVKYDCRICRSEFKSGRGLIDHLTNYHKMSQKKYINDHGELKTKKSIFTCKICSVKFNFSNICLRNHLRAHGLNCREYFDQYIEPSSAAGASRNSTVLSKKKTSTSNGKQSSFTNYLFDWNQCGFECVRCNLSFGSNSSMYKHGASHHPGVKYDVLLRKTPRFHTCLVCGSEIMCNKPNVRKHLKAVHNMRIQSYEKKFNAKLEKTLKKAQ